MKHDEKYCKEHGMDIERMTIEQSVKYLNDHGYGDRLYIKDGQIFFDPSIRGCESKIVYREKE